MWSIVIPLVILLLVVVYQISRTEYFTGSSNLTVDCTTGRILNLASCNEVGSGYKVKDGIIVDAFGTKFGDVPPSCKSSYGTEANWTLVGTATDNMCPSVIATGSGDDFTVDCNTGAVFDSKCKAATGEFKISESGAVTRNNSTTIIGHVPSVCEGSTFNAAGAWNKVAVSYDSKDRIPFPEKCFSPVNCIAGRSYSTTGKSPCKTCTNCSALNKVTTTACTSTADAVCGGCKDGYTLTDGVCVAPCVEGNWSATGKTPCESCTDCSTLFKNTTTACTLTTDAVCGGCKPGYTLTDGKCVAPGMGTACVAGETYSTSGNIPCTDCTDCDSLHKYTTTACTKTTNAICGGCKPGYTLSNGACIPSSSTQCVAGATYSTSGVPPCSDCTDCSALNKETITSCKSTANAVCGACKTGYTLTNGVCVATAAATQTGNITMSLSDLLALFSGATAAAATGTTAAAAGTSSSSAAASPAATANGYSYQDLYTQLRPSILADIKELDSNCASAALQQGQDYIRKDSIPCYGCSL
jgi:hypothetical protein